MNSVSRAALVSLANRLEESITQLGTQAHAASLGGTPFDEDTFNNLAVELFALQTRLNPAYGAWCTSKKCTLESVRSWRDIPAVSVDTFKEFPLSCIPKALQSRWFHSSGTTARQSSTHAHFDRSLRLYEVALSAWFQASVLASSSQSNPLPQERRTEHWISLTPGPDTVPTSSLVYMLDSLGRTFSGENIRFVGYLGASGGWEVDVDAFDQAIRHAWSTGSVLRVFGTAFNWVHCLDARRASDTESMPLPPGSCVLETGGYKGRSRELTREQLVLELNEAYQIPADRVVREYGMCELSSQAYDWFGGQPSRLDSAGSDSRVFRFPPWTRTRVLCPETGRELPPGEVGLLQIVDLANVWSVAAILTADRVRQTPEGFELLGRNPGAEARGCSLRSLDAPSPICLERAGEWGRTTGRVRREVAC